MPWQLTDQVQRVLQEEGLTPQDLEEMLARAAITSLRGATRRYHHWFFRVQGDDVLKMFKHVPAMDGVQMWVKHRLCGGAGCKDCLWSGEEPRN